MAAVLGPGDPPPLPSQPPTPPVHSSSLQAPTQPVPISSMSTPEPPFQYSSGVTPEERPRSWKSVRLGEQDTSDRLHLDPGLFKGKDCVSFAEGPARTPIISFDQTILDALATAWTNCIAFKPLGVKFRFEYMCRRIRFAMNIQGKFRINDLANGYFLLKLKEKSDYDSILTGGPWPVYGHYLAVKTWSADFDPYNDEIISTPIWIRFINLPILFYEETALEHIASGFGEPLKVDSRTLFADRGRFARCCVNLDLTQPLPSSVIVMGSEFRVEYENLAAICTSCGLFGHFTPQCPKNRASSLEGQNEEQPQNWSKNFTSLPSGQESDWRVKRGKRWIVKQKSPPVPIAQQEDESRANEIASVILSHSPAPETKSEKPAPSSPTTLSAPTSARARAPIPSCSPTHNRFSALSVESSETPDNPEARLLFGSEFAESGIGFKPKVVSRPDTCLGKELRSEEEDKVEACSEEEDCLEVLSRESQENALSRDANGDWLSRDEEDGVLNEDEDVEIRATVPRSEDFQRMDHDDDLFINLQIDSNLVGLGMVGAV